MLQFLIIWSLLKRVKVVINPLLALLAEDSILFCICHLASLQTELQLDHFPIKTFFIDQPPLELFPIRSLSLRPFSNQTIIHYSYIFRPFFIRSSSVSQKNPNLCPLKSALGQNFFQNSSDRGWLDFYQISLDSSGPQLNPHCKFFFSLSVLWFICLLGCLFCFFAMFFLILAV